MKYSNATNVNSQILKNDLKVYPNPGNGRFTIEWNDLLNEELDVQVFNLSGQVIFARHSAFNQKMDIDLSANSGGLYLIRMTTDRQVLTKQLVIQ